MALRVSTPGRALLRSWLSICFNALNGPSRFDRIRTLNSPPHPNTCFNALNGPSRFDRYRLGWVSPDFGTFQCPEWPFAFRPYIREVLPSGYTYQSFNALNGPSRFDVIREENGVPLVIKIQDQFQCPEWPFAFRLRGRGVGRTRRRRVSMP